jgi:hypothetical protein
LLSIGYAGLNCYALDGALSLAALVTAAARICPVAYVVRLSGVRHQAENGSVQKNLTLAQQFHSQ